MADRDRLSELVERVGDVLLVIEVPRSDETTPVGHFNDRGKLLGVDPGASPSEEIGRDGLPVGPATLQFSADHGP